MIFIKSIAIFMIFYSVTANSQELGIGIIVGEPTGISLKRWLSETTAIDGAVAWSLGNRSSLQLHADYLFHNDSLIDIAESKEKYPVYFGVGGRIRVKNSKESGKTDDDTHIGLRFPVGIAYKFNDAPFDLFFEFVPILDIIPGTDLDLNAAIGARFWFY